MFAPCGFLRGYEPRAFLANNMDEGHVESDVNHDNIQSYRQFVKDEIENYRNFLQERERKRIIRRVKDYRKFRERNYDLVTEEEIEIYRKDQAGCSDRRLKRRLRLWVKYVLRNGPKYDGRS